MRPDVEKLVTGLSFAVGKHLPILPFDDVKFGFPSKVDVYQNPGWVAQVLPKGPRALLVFLSMDISFLTEGVNGWKVDPTQSRYLQIIGGATTARLGEVLDGTVLEVIIDGARTTVFDVLAYRGSDTTRLPLVERLRIATQAVGEIEHFRPPRPRRRSPADPGGRPQHLFIWRFAPTERAERLALVHNGNIAGARVLYRDLRDAYTLEATFDGTTTHQVRWFMRGVD